MIDKVEQRAYPELGRLTDLYVTSRLGWVVSLCLGVLVLLFSGFIIYLSVEQGEAGHQNEAVGAGGGGDLATAGA